MNTYIATLKAREHVTFEAASDKAALKMVRAMHRVTEVFRRTDRGYERIAA